jgi:hypothetical protein
VVSFAVTLNWYIVFKSREAFGSLFLFVCENISSNAIMRCNYKEIYHLMASLAGYNVREVSLLTSAAHVPLRRLRVRPVSTILAPREHLSVILDVTATTTGALTVSIDAKDPVSGKYYNLLTGAAVTTVSTNRYTVGPSVLQPRQTSMLKPTFPSTFRVVVTVADATRCHLLARLLHRDLT